MAVCPPPFVKLTGAERLCQGCGGFAVKSFQGADIALIFDAFLPGQLEEIFLLQEAAIAFRVRQDRDVSHVPNGADHVLPGARKVVLGQFHQQVDSVVGQGSVSAQLLIELVVQHVFRREPELELFFSGVGKQLVKTAAQEIGRIVRVARHDMGSAVSSFESHGLEPANDSQAFFKAGGSVVHSP